MENGFTNKKNKQRQKRKEGDDGYTHVKNEESQTTTKGESKLNI